MTNEEIEESLKNMCDGELLMLYHEEDENAKNLLFYKYKFIIDILIAKYRNVISKLNIDYEEVRSECLVGFSDGIKSYQDDKDTSLPTFITICIERRIKNIIRKYNRKKNQGLIDNFSLDLMYDTNNSLLDVLGDDWANDPLRNVLESEDYKHLLKEIKNGLTKAEYDVFVLLYNGTTLPGMAKILNKTYKQIDNTIQRVRGKIKRILIKEAKNI